MGSKDKRTRMKYEKWVHVFAGTDEGAAAEAMAEIEAELLSAQQSGYSANLEMISVLESVLVCLLAHHMDDIRETAIVLLNVLYDGHDLQLHESLTVQIATVDEAQLFLKIPLRENADITRLADGSALRFRFFGPSKELHAPPRWTDLPVSVVSLPTSSGAERPRAVSVTFPPFPRAGFYDWILCTQEPNGAAPDGLLNALFDHRRVKGRVIVHPAGVRGDFFMEIPVEQVGATWDENSGELQNRGDFDSVLEVLPELKVRGITGVYLMGSLERSMNERDSSPFSVADRSRPSSRLGGGRAFGNLVHEMRRLNIRAIVDGLERVASASHRKYRKYIVEYRNDHGIICPHPGTDARETQWPDTKLLNYRRVEVWDMMISETKELVREYGVGGIRLDNAQSYPVTLSADLQELLRRDPDGELHHSLDEIFYGQVVQPNSECGYWRSEACMDLNYPNPFLIKYMKEMWNEFPDFVVVAESHFHREVEIVQSGMIAQSLRVPQILASVAGRSLRRDGSVAKIAMNKKSTAKTLTRVLRNDAEYMPKNPIMIQSTCTHSSPYPGGLYGRKSWIVVDLMYLLPGVPMLLFGEDAGRALRLNMMGLSNAEESSAYDVHFDSLLPKSPPKNKNSSSRNSPADGLASMSKSKLIISGSQQSLLGMRRVLSGANMQKMGGAGGMQRVESKSRLSGALKLSRQGSFQDMKKAADEQSNGPTSGGNGAAFKSPALVRTQSKTELQSSSIRSSTASDIRNMNEMNRKIYEEIGPHSGFDLAQIKGHYHHRELVRIESNVLRNGAFSLLSLGAQYSEQFFAFARYTSTAIYIVVVNFRDVQDGEFYKEGKEVDLSLQALADCLSDEMLRNTSALYCLKDTFSGDRRDDKTYTLEEILFRRHRIFVGPLQTVLLEVSQAPEGSSEEHVRQCVNRLSTEANDIKDPRENALLAALTRSAADSVDEFAKALMELYHALLESNFEQHWIEYLLQISLQRASGLRAGVEYEGIEHPKDFAPPEGERIIAYLVQLAMAAADPDVKEAARLLVKKSQKIGPLVFVCPEYGRFSTAGGLGVMVDELTKDLADLGLDVYVISPYYTVNRKNQSGYLEMDKFPWRRNIDVNLGTHMVECGVYEGKEDGVNLIFIERQDYFPKVYADAGSQERLLQTIVLMSLSALEVCCQKGITPALFVTNDWLPSLAAGYGKHGFFGNFFENTTFFHLIHNLGDGAYEGRVYPAPDQGDMGYVHRLPGHMLVDPWWSQKIVNPSRCALMCSDSWGTVSQSYMRELKQGHPLKDLLCIAKAPFAFPNGIRQAHREQLLQTKGAESHDAAKRILQQKYFNFQDIDNSIPLFAFVGRITSQKGVHLILNAADELIQHANGKIQIIVGGPATWSDSYSSGCARHMQDLRRRHPFCFWADPDAFFMDGPLVNLGSDFGVMPSVFEPGGIVQQEFFVAGTPVVAFKTGGLKDTVHEWNTDTGEGNGFTFDNYTHNDFVSAMKRALRVFARKTEYEELRESAYETTIDVSTVAWAWSSEFHRLRGAIYAQSSGISGELEKVARVGSSSAFDPSSVPVRIVWSGPADEVEVLGSFDGWTQRMRLSDDENTNEKSIVLRLPRGEYYFKFKVNSSWCLSNDYEKRHDGQFENNYLNV